MTFEEFWNEYYIKEDITTISDTVIEMFSQDFSDEIRKSYDLVEIVTEFTGHHETANKYDKTEAFQKVLKQYHPTEYEECKIYLLGDLIEYACYKKDKTKLEEYVADILSSDYDYDHLLINIKSITYYGHIDLTDQIIEKQYNFIKNSDEIIPGGEYDLALYKYYIELEKTIPKDANNKDIDWASFHNKLEPYDFDIPLNASEYLDFAVSNPTLTELKEKLATFPSQRTLTLIMLELRFLVRMRERGCSFSIGGTIWNNFIEYFEEHKSKTWSDYFKIKEKDFKDFLSSRSGFFFSNDIDIMLLLWGGKYLLDFLKSDNIIDIDSYQSQQNHIDQLIEKFKKQEKNYLWKYSFVHNWSPPETISTEDWETEAQEFEDSYDLPIAERTFEFDGPSEFTFAPLFAKPQRELPPVRHAKPIGTPKIGRNEKVTVQYKDGTIKTLKYKKVMKDIEAGECELLTLEI